MEVTATSHPCLLPSVPFSLLHLHTHYYPPGMAISALLAFLLQSLLEGRFALLILNPSKL